MKPAFRSAFLLLLLMLMFCPLSGSSAAPSSSRSLLASTAACAPLPPATGSTRLVSTVQQLEQAVNGASSNSTILIADGTYNLNGVYLRIDTPGLTLRSASGNRDAVILDGNYVTTEIFQIAASNVTIADLTLREAYFHPIHVVSTESADTLNTLIYDVHIIDPGQQAIKVNPYTGSNAQHFIDNGVIACSHIELTAVGRSHIRDSCYTGGIDIHQARGWVIRDNTIEGFWCQNGLSEHAIHMWRSCRDTTVERNLLRNNARGVGFGMATDGSGIRTYPDNPCPSASGYVDDYGGIIRNNMIFAQEAGLFASQFGFDCGICLWNSCSARVLHNTVYTTNPASTFSSIEWRFPNTRAEVTNNLVNHTMRQRDSAIATQAGNLTTAASGWFVNAAAGDLHILPSAAQVVDQAVAVSGSPDDFDGDARPAGSAAEIGADEYRIPAPPAVRDLRVVSAVASSGSVTLTLRWTPPPGAAVAMLRSSSAPITASSWSSATLINGSLSGGTNTYTVTLPYTGGTLFFALKTRSAEGIESEISNLAFYPAYPGYLPVIRH